MTFLMMHMNMKHLHECFCVLLPGVMLLLFKLQKTGIKAVILTSVTYNLGFIFELLAIVPTHNDR